MEGEAKQKKTEAEDGHGRGGDGIVDDGLEGGVDGSGGFWVAGLEGVSCPVRSRLGKG